METALHQLSDQMLLDKVLFRSEPAWQELIRRFRALMFRCITRIAGKYDAVLSSEDANEIFADVCFNLLRDNMRKLRAWDPTRGAKLGSWLGLIAINSTYDFLRQTARRPMLDRLERAADPAAEAPDALDMVIDKERWRRVNRMLDGFSKKDRRFVQLYFADGLEPEEVAREMGISVKTVYSKKNKVRTKLLAMAEAA
jgi:RNA polymerase sigma-70 factor (ECF subfamily)